MTLESAHLVDGLVCRALMVVFRSLYPVTGGGSDVAIELEIH